jgi:hypothetical protein
MKQEQFVVAKQEFEMGLVGQFCWAEFRDNMKAVAVDEDQMEKWFDWLANLMANDMTGADDDGFRPQEFEYKLDVEIMYRDEAKENSDEVDVSKAGLVLRLVPMSERVQAVIQEGMSMTAFRWPVINNEGVLMIEAFSYDMLRYARPVVSKLVQGVQAPATMAEDTLVQERDPDWGEEPASQKKLTTRPVFGWLKEALTKGVVSYEDLKELLKQPLFFSLAHKEDTYVSFFRKLDKYLEGEFPVLNKERPLFGLRFSNTQETMYGLLTITYHSQRHDADVKRNTLNVLCPLSWGNDADWPVIIDPEVSFQPMHYTGTLAEHAATEVRFSLQRAASRINLEAPVVDQLQSFLNDGTLAQIIDRRLVEANIHHEVKSVFVQPKGSFTYVQTEEPLQFHAQAFFFPAHEPSWEPNEAIALLDLVMDYTEPFFVWRHDAGQVELLERKPSSDKHAGVSQTLKFSVGDGAKFQTMADPAQQAESTMDLNALRAQAAKHAMESSANARPIVGQAAMPMEAVHQGFDIALEMTFLDSRVPYPVLNAFMGLFPDLFVKYARLLEELSYRGVQINQEPVMLELRGQVSDILGDQKTEVVLRLVCVDVSDDSIGSSVDVKYCFKR